MKKPSLFVHLAGIVVVLCLSSQLFAVNRFYINNQTVDVGSTGNTVSILADVDQNTYGFSISLQYDATKIAITQVEPGAAASALTPEYSEGIISTSPGRVVHGVVFDMSDPITKFLTTGTAKEVLKLTVNVIASAESTTVLDLVNVSGNPSRLNVMTNANGDSVTPAPNLVDGTLTLRKTAAPVITLILNNTGLAGKSFFVTGQNFGEAGLAVTVCSVAASFTVKDSSTLEVTAPACGTVGWAPLRVTTVAGFDEEAQGFQYEDTGGTLFLRGDANDDATVDLSDAVTILGDLFLGSAASAPCRDALDGNDDGTIDLSDAVAVLSFLFTGGADIPPPGIEIPGPDPTPDVDIPPCD